ncbi:HAD family hydrolase [Saccharopolyspora sp. 6V]|uniref:HAD family hydrolase n=1 Tax=Saccharopolyspora sp. 6V TaxID=2877239 RepID=UPI001CD5DB10|nr:haloacid dehalogenase-like hydrolase [Saccharopolyspora sp. 6V]MCA1193840.1 haloacid dehalogenase-like hydrolase [Saccharopolyspora sp. 6V]
MPSGHIVWDWNGTLLDDGEAMIGAVIAAFADAGLAVTVEDHQRLFTRPISVFCERLANGPLAAAELAELLGGFDEHYARALPDLALAADAESALAGWAASGGTQSLLSMCPHEVLVPMVRAAGITGSFRHVQGRSGEFADTKAAHVRAHLRALGDPDPARVVFIGDTVDDAAAAASVGARCVVYHSGRSALHARDHFAGSGAPLVGSLTEAVTTAHELLAA